MRISILSLKIILSLSLVSLPAQGKNKDETPWDYCEHCSEELDHAINDLKDCNSAKKITEWYQDPTVVSLLVIAGFGAGYAFSDTLRSVLNHKIYETKGIKIGF